MANISSNNTYSNNNINSKNSNELKYHKLFIIIVFISFVIPIIIYNSVRNFFYEFFKKLGDFLYSLLKERKLKNPWKKDDQSKKDSGDQGMELKLLNNEINKGKEINIIHVKSFELKGNINENKKDDDDKMFLKTFLGRLIITYYSFYGLIFIFNFAIQFLTLIPGTISKIGCKYIEYIILFLYVVYSIFYSRILLIPAFEFFSFPFIRFKDSLSHLWTFNYIEKNEQFKSEYSNKNNEILNFFFLLIEVSYLICFILGILTSYLTFMDYFNFCILLIVYIYYLSILFSYFFIAFKTIDKKRLSDINLLSYFFNPSKEEKKDKEVTHFLYILYLLEIIVFLCLIICAVFGFFKIDKFFFKLIILVIYFLLGFFCRFYFFSYFGIRRKKERQNTRMIFLLSLFSIMICTVTSLILIYILYPIKVDDDKLSYFDRFDSIRQSDEYLDNNKSNILPSICTASVYNIPIISYIPFINDAYYYNDTKSSLDYLNYRNIFFNDNEYNITVKGNLIKDKTKNVKMIQYNLENQKNNVTILSIKGTTYNTDVYLDIQLYTPSVFLNLLLDFSIFMKLKDSLSFHLLEYSLSLPYRMFFKESIIDDYIKVLYKTYNNISKEFDNNNVIIVGHSLGGGLSKILGKMVKKPSISLSGPGANAFHSLWGEDGISDNFDITTIDLVADMDLVPRVEVSGGTIYRIICREGPFGCHSKDLSLCEVLIMCQKPHEIVCQDIAGIHGDKLERIKKASQLFKE